MPKYKYVDGVKYRVVPQSVLGYALVREDSDNSLPAGGTEGQVLAKASDTDYDVEWATVQSGGGDSAFIVIPFTRNDSTFTIQLDSTTIAEYKQLILGGSLPVLSENYNDMDFLTYPDVYYNSSVEHVWQFASFRAGAQPLYLDVDSMTIMDEFD